MKNLHQFLLWEVSQPEDSERNDMARKFLMILFYIVKKCINATPRTKTPTNEVDQIELLEVLIDLVAITLVKPGLQPVSD